MPDEPQKTSPVEEEIEKLRQLKALVDAQKDLRAAARMNLQAGSTQV